MGYKVNVSQLISIVDFWNLVWVLMFSKLAYAMIKNGKWSYVSQLISIVDFWNLVWVLIGVVNKVMLISTHAKLAYAFQN